MYSPNNSATDPNSISFNVLWPVKDIKVNEAIYRDFLQGITEAKFRSTRLHTWFYTPEQYYTKTLEELRRKDVNYEVESEHVRIQENHPLRGSIDLKEIKVFTDDTEVKKSISDSKFKIVEKIEEADVYWGLGLSRSHEIQKAKER